VGDVEVAVAIEVAERGAEAHALQVQSPRRADGLEAQVAEVAEGEVGLGEHWALAHDAHAVGEVDRGEDALAHVRVLVLTVHAVGDVEVEAAVVVEVLEAHGPGPVGGVEAGEVGGLEHGASAGVHVEHVAQILGRDPGLVVVQPHGIAGRGHAALVGDVGSCRHVGDEEVDAPVVVDVAEIRAHGRQRYLWHDIVDTIGERAVAVVAVETVGGGEVVGDVEIRPPVGIEVPPNRGMAERVAEHTGSVGHVGEETVAAIAVEAVLSAVWIRHGVEHVGLDVDIEPTVAVVVAERTGATGVGEGEPAGCTFLAKRPIALVDEEEIGRAEAGDVEVEPAVVVDVGEAGPLLPERCGFHPGRTRHESGAKRDVLEAPIPEIAKEARLLGLADDEEVGPAVIVVVADGDAGADRSEGKLLVALPPHRGIGVSVLGDDPGGGSVDRREHRGTARVGSLGEGAGLEERGIVTHRRTLGGGGEPCEGRAQGQGATAGA